MASLDTKRKLVIAFDCDDVLVPTSLMLLDAYNREFGTEVNPKYFYGEHESWGVCKRDVVKRIHDLHRLKIVTSASPLQEVVREITYLAGAGHELYVITGRYDFQAEDTLAQLTMHFPGIFRSVQFTSYFGASSRDKGEVCKEVGVDLLIDDHIHHCNRANEAGVGAILFGDYPWNSDESQLAPGIKRLRTMKDVREEIDRVTRG